MQAIADFDEAIRLKSDYAGSLQQYEVNAKGELGRHEDAAIADFDEAIRLKPDLRRSLQQPEELQRGVLGQL